MDTAAFKTLAESIFDKPNVHTNKDIECDLENIEKMCDAVYGYMMK